MEVVTEMHGQQWWHARNKKASVEGARTWEIGGVWLAGHVNQSLSPQRALARSVSSPKICRGHHGEGDVWRHRKVQIYRALIPPTDQELA
jgi:hypothetical protein